MSSACRGRAEADLELSQVYRLPKEEEVGRNLSVCQQLWALNDGPLKPDLPPVTVVTLRQGCQHLSCLAGRPMQDDAQQLVTKLYAHSKMLEHALSTAYSTSSHIASGSQLLQCCFSIDRGNCDAAWTPCSLGSVATNMHT